MHCVNQLEVRNPKTGVIISVPCGKCYACQSNKRAEWAFRNSVELQYSNSAFFVTLTYDDASLASLPKHCTIGLRMPINSHYQRFFKRLRKSLDPIKLRYFLCHEYGDETLRPHYHILLYLSDTYTLKDIRNLLRSCWSYGNITADYVNAARIHYMSKYLLKQFRNVKRGGRTRRYIFSDPWSNTELQQLYFKNYFLKYFSFIRVSRGLGTQLLKEPQFLSWFWNNLKPGEELPLYFLNGRTYSLPRIYLRKLIPGFWHDDVVPENSTAVEMERIFERARDAGLTVSEYISNSEYIQRKQQKLLQRSFKNRNPL